MIDLPAPAPLALTLLHSLWQAAAVALLVWAALAVLPVRRAGIRHAVATAGLFATLGLAVATHAWLAAAAEAPAVAPAEAVAAPDVQAPRVPRTVEILGPSEPRSAAPLAAAAWERAAPLPWSALAAWLCGTWAVGVIVMLVRLTRGVDRATRLRRAAAPAPTWLQDRADRLRERMGMTRAVAVRVCDGLLQPAAVGLLSPAVLLPPAVVAGDAAALRVILAHELAHLRGFHPLLALASSAVEALLFFNPAVRWLASRAALEREAVCDAAAAAFDGPEAVAATLGRAAVGGFAPPPAALNFPGDHGRGGVLERMRRLLEPGRSAGGAAPWVLIGLLLIGVIALASVHFAATRAAVAILDGPAFVERAAEVHATRAAAATGEDAKPATLRGVVVREDATPLADPPRVDFFSRGGRGHKRWSGWSRHAEDGGVVFEEEDVDPGAVELAIAHAQGFAPTVLGPFPVQPGETVEGLRLVLGEGFSAVLRVVDEDGNAVDDAEVTSASISTTTGSLNVTVDAEGGADGRVALDHLAGLVYTVEVAAEGLQPRRFEWIPKPGEVHEVTLMPAVPTGGVVVSAATGEPLAGVRLAAASGFGERSTQDPRGNADLPEATSGAEGVFQFPTLPAGTTGTVWAEGAGHGPRILWNLEAGRTDWRVELAATPELRVVLPAAADGDDGERPESLRWSQSVELKPSAFWGQTFGPVPFVDAPDGASVAVISGGFVRAPLELFVGPHTVRVEDPWSGPVVLDPSAAEPELPTRPVVLRLTPPPGWPAAEGRLEVYALTPGADGYAEPGMLPIRGGEVRLGVPVGVQRWNADGGGVIRYGPIDAPGYRVEEASEVVIPPGEGSHTLDVPLLPAGTVSGRVRVPAGQDPSQAWVSVHMVEKPVAEDGSVIDLSINQFNNIRVTPTGSFAVSGLPLGGSYRLEARAGAPTLTQVRTDSFPLDLERPIHETEVVLPVGTDVEVEVLGLGGNPLANAEVTYEWAKPEGGGSTSYRQLTEPAGTTVLQGINLDLSGEHLVRIAPLSRSNGGFRGARVPIPASGGPLTVRLEAGLTASGRIINKTTGKPIADRPLELVPADPEARAPRVEGRTGPDGRFFLGGLDPIGYRVDVEGMLPAGSEVVSTDGGNPGWRYPPGWPFEPDLTAPAENVEIAMLPEPRPR